MAQGNYFREVTVRVTVRVDLTEYNAQRAAAGNDIPADYDDTLEVAGEYLQNLIRHHGQGVDEIASARVEGF